MIDANMLSKALEHLIPATQFYYFETIDSTNLFLKTKTEIKENTLSCCIADEQTAGRGRFGKMWLSPKGVNIYCSIGTSLPSARQNVSGISLALSLSVLRAIKIYIPKQTLFVKWPNDILCEHKKLCGILIERYGNQLIIGIGINVNNRFDERYLQPEKPCGSIYELTGKLTNRNELLIDLIDRISQDLTRFWKLGLSDFMTEWEAVDYLAGKKIKMSIDKKEVVGFSRGITSEGQLKFEDSQGKMHLLISGNASLLSFL